MVTQRRFHGVRWNRLWWCTPVPTLTWATSMTRSVLEDEADGRLGGDAAGWRCAGRSPCRRRAPGGRRRWCWRSWGPSQDGDEHGPGEGAGGGFVGDVDDAAGSTTKEMTRRTTTSAAWSALGWSGSWPATNVRARPSRSGSWSWASSSRASGSWCTSRSTKGCWRVRRSVSTKAATPRGGVVAGGGRRRADGHARGGWLLPGDEAAGAGRPWSGTGSRRSSARPRPAWRRRPSWCSRP